MSKPADPLEYYACSGPITDPGEYVGLFEGLPTGVPALCQVVQGVMIHRDSANWRGVQLTEKQKQDADLRHVARLLARIHEVDDRPLTIPRPLEKRLAITCRDFATVLCAMLRRQGAPARPRCGFATYFRGPDSTPGFHVDHWVCEYWKPDERRWVLVDAEIDEGARSHAHVTLDACDVPCDQFLVAGKAWQLCRAGQADPDSFGLGPSSMHGLWYIVSQLVRDLASLNKMELLCWDCWALGDIEEGGIPSAEDAALLDRVAALTLADNEAFAEMRSLYENDDRLRVPPIIRSYNDAGVREIKIFDD
jgi:hypothetical protein